MARGSMNHPPGEEVIKRLSSEASPGLLREVLALMRHNKKWWLLPALITLLATGVLLVLAGSGAAPFVYTLF